MDYSTKTPLRIGDWSVDPAADQISRGTETVRLEARTMRLLLCLAERPGDVFSIDELLDRAWPGVIVTPDSVYQAVTSLRRLLGDDSKQPLYIATVPRRGYRLVADVSEQGEVSAMVAAAARPRSDVAPAPLPNGMPNTHSRPAMRLFAAAAVILIGGGLAAYALLARAPPAVATAAAMHASRSIAVLPFLDLTDTMNEEPFADGMTEELIDALSKVPNLQVSAPTASFYFKGKQATVGEIGNSLGVTYVLDGSVRKSGSTLRIASRLVRADDGFVIWSETYDRPLDDRLRVQDDIAGEVTKALKGSIR
jgi:TolB-like protein/DNA-binding winged helix-turn-helix (wHTH) protein